MLINVDQYVRECIKFKVCLCWQSYSRLLIVCMRFSLFFFVFFLFILSFRFFRPLCLRLCLYHSNATRSFNAEGRFINETHGTIGQKQKWVIFRVSFFLLCVRLSTSTILYHSITPNCQCIANCHFLLILIYFEFIESTTK